MSNNLKWSIKDLQDKGLAQNKDGTFVPVKSLVAKGKVLKIEPFYTHAEDGMTFNYLNSKRNEFTNADKVPQIITTGFLFPNDNIYKAPENETIVQIKPLSVNEVWKGRRFKTPQYMQYALAVSLLLPNDLVVPEGLLRVYYEFGLSYSGGDWDNPVKPFQDILQEKYKFNDSRIMEATVKKVMVKKGQEYISFKIESL